MQLKFFVVILTGFVLLALTGQLATDILSAETTPAWTEVSAENVGMPLYVGNIPVVPLYNIDDRSPFAVVWNGKQYDCRGCASWTTILEGLEFRFEDGVLIVRSKEE